MSAEPWALWLFYWGSWLLAAIVITIACLLLDKRYSAGGDE